MPAEDSEPQHLTSANPEAASTGRAKRAAASPKTYPTRWQMKMLWMAITGLSLLTLGALAVFVLFLISRAIGFLQAFLLPVAVAGVLTYLLAPLVDKLRERGMPHKRAALIVFLAFILGAGGLIAAIAIPVTQQFKQMGQSMPVIYHRFEGLIGQHLSPEGMEKLIKQWEAHPLAGPLIKFTPFGTKPPKENGEGQPGEVSSTTSATAQNPVVTPETSAPPPENGTGSISLENRDSEEFLRDFFSGKVNEVTVFPEFPTPAGEAPLQANQTPAPGSTAAGTEPAPSSITTPQNIPELRAALGRIAQGAWDWIVGSIGGVFGVFGFLLNFLLVPLYLFFFLRETYSIQANWSRYLPLRASRFKDEIVSLVQEINGYLISFFRGQMLVSLIDGFFTALILQALGLKFGLLIGVLVGILGFVPYIGIMICFVPAFIIAIVQATQGGWGWAPNAPWWVLPLLVSATFLLVNNLDGIFIAPKIVGDSVGLHPLMIIVSVIFWSLVLGGVLGAILAVPLTATLGVIFRRYIWQRPVPEEGTSPPQSGEGGVMVTAPPAITIIPAGEGGEVRGNSGSVMEPTALEQPLPEPTAQPNAVARRRRKRGSK